MEIILLERIEHLGQMGEVVRVKPGYARNYLLPQKKAVRATGDNRKRFEEQRAQLEATNLERRSEAEAVAVKLDGLAVMLIRQAGEAGQLYGSVTARDVADAVTSAGFTVARNQIRLNQPIKTLGLHKVAVGLHPEVAVGITVNVARSTEEAQTQTRTGAAVARTGAERREEEVEVGEQQLQAMLEAEVGEQPQDEPAER
jgi:large subunit ribosomal protein L9